MDGANLNHHVCELTTLQLAAQITELMGHLNAATYRWLVLTAEFDQRGGWNDGSTQSCAHWLNWQCGINLGAAREKVRVARALGDLPQISAAMERGELSYSKVRALTRIANSATEDYLLELALRGTAHHVETIVRAFRRCQEAEELSRESRQHANRSVTWIFDDDGSLIVKARLPAETGRLFRMALEKASEALPQPDVSAETHVREFGPKTAQLADALALVAESFIKHGLEDMTGGERHEIVVHVEDTTLRDSTCGRCELEHGPALAAETARRLACDAGVYTIVEDDKGEPLNIGRKSRTIPPALRRALNARDRGCRFPGCPNKRFVDGHHIKHWANGGETSLANLVTLCRFHHRQVHEGRVGVQVLDDGAFRFARSNGALFDSPMPLPCAPVRWERLMEENALAGLEIDARTAATRWQGERIDYSTAIVGLFHTERKARRVSAET